MSIINRNTLKSKFETGKLATQSNFEDLIDSSFNRNEDSILLGPTGVTGQWGLLGPTGGTYIGLHLIGGTGPTGTTSIGSTGQVYIGLSGPTANLYIHNGTQWFRFVGSTAF